MFPALHSGRRFNEAALAVASGWEASLPAIGGWSDQSAWTGCGAAGQVSSYALRLIPAQRPPVEEGVTGQ